MVDDKQYRQFGSLNVLMMDSNPQSANATRQLLSSLGVYQIRMASDLSQLSDMLNEHAADIITYDMGEKDSATIDYIYKLRDSSQDYALSPLLALSRETTVQDLRTMVDAGVTEIIGQPAEIRHIYSRFQHVVDNPRSFVAAKQFKGPDRRRKTKTDTEGEARETLAPKLITRDKYIAGDYEGAVAIMPDFKLKAKVSKLVSGAIPQAAEDEFIFRVLSEVDAVEASYTALTQSLNAAPHIERICNACMSIEARSEAYGYALGCILARSMSNFCQRHFRPGKPSHMVVLQKHYQTLSTIYRGRLNGDGGEQGRALVQDLGQLIKKYV